MTKLNSSKILIALLLFLCFSAKISKAQTNVTLQGQLSYSVGINDVWGYVDGSGNEYALVGTQTTFSIVDISTPSAPTEILSVPGATTTWRDVKIWNDYAYIINEASTGGGLMIVDLSVLPGGTPTVTYSTLGVGYTDSHNIFIDENGIGYLFGASSSGVGGGTIICDIAANPTNPPYLGIYTTNYVHDGYVRGDTMWTGEIYAGELGVVDVSNKAVPLRLSGVGTPNAFTHNCWISDDGQTVFTTDERDGSFVTAYDVSDIYDMKEIDRYQAFPGTNVIPHNTFVKDDFLVTSYYTSGAKITDATYPYNLIETGFYDTSPNTGGGFAGCWGVYPFFNNSNTLLATDRQLGLFVLSMNCVQAAYLEGTVTDINTGNTIVSASVTVTDASGNPATFGNGYFTKSDLIGFYATGASQTGTYTVTVEAPCYQTLTVTGVNLTSGIITNLPAQMTPIVSAPINLTTSNITTTTADLSWDIDLNAASYNVYYRPVGSTTWTILPATTNSISLTGLTPGTIYQFQIESICGSGVSTGTTASNFTTVAPCNVPTGLTVNNITTTGADISWTAISGANSYLVSYRPVGTSTWQTVTVSSNSTTLTGLTPNTPYEYVVDANCGSISGTSGNSSTTTFTTLILCTTPTNLMVSTITDTQASISWTGITNGTSYTLYYREVGTTTWISISVSSTTYLLTGLNPNTDYEFYVEGNCSGTTGTASNTTPFTTLQVCLAPTNITSSNVTTNSATISWNGVSNGVDYILSYRPVGTTTWMTITVTGTSTNLSGLMDGTTYEFEVQTNCDASSLPTSPTSTTNNFTTPILCTTPTNMTATNISDTQTDLSWTGIANGVSYNLYYQEVGASAWNSIVVSGTSYTLTGLNPGVDYIFYVESDCGGGITGTPSVTTPFTTLQVCPTPTNISSSNIANNSATISWNGVSNGVDYILSYRPVGTTTWTTITVTGNSTNLSGLMDGTTYEFEVQTNCDASSLPTSPTSTTNNFTTPILCTTPTNMTATNISDTQTDLSWTGVANGVSYNLYYQEVGASAWNSIVVSGTSYTLTGLNPGVDYSFYVESDCGGGITGIPSVTTPFTTLQACSAPTGLTATNITDVSASLNWNALPNANTYIVSYRPVGSSTWITNTTGFTSFNITDLNPSTNYEFIVQANCNANSVPTSPNSNTTPFSTTISCITPSNFNLINVTSSQATINWTGHNSATNYIVQVRPFGSSTWITQNIQSFGNFYTISDLLPCTTYELELYAECGGVFSSIVNDTFITTPPSAAWTSALTTICNGTTDLNTYVSGTNGGIWSGGSYVSSSGVFDPDGLQPGDYTVTYTVGAIGCQDSQTYNIMVEECIATVSVKMLLAGPYDPATGKMTTILNSLNLIPSTQPYSIAPWNYAGTETFSSIDDKVVDWVLVELRDVDTTTVVATQAALLLEDGTITDVDGVAGLSFKNLNYNDSYFLVVRHRNHLDVMSNGTVSLNALYDFTSGANQAFGTGQVADVGGGKFALHAGDCSGDGTVTVVDYNLYRSQASLISQYLLGDINLDKTVTVKDFNIYQPNASLIGVSFVRY